MKKRSFAMTAGGLAVTALILVFYYGSAAKKYSPTSTLGSRAVASNSSGGKDLATIDNRGDELVERVEPKVDLKALGIDVEPYQDVTNDTAVIQLLVQQKHKQTIGSVRKNSSNDVVLELDDGRQFKAAYVDERRTMASNGSVALAAVTVPNGTKMTGVDAGVGEGDLRGDPGEIWLLLANGKSERVSPAHAHSTNPVISPDGRYVAFTAQYLINGSLYPETLLIRDTHGGEIKSYGERKYGHDYVISAVDWVEHGKVLRVLDDWGETGGHLRLKQVRLE